MHRAMQRTSGTNIQSAAALAALLCFHHSPCAPASRSAPSMVSIDDMLNARASSSRRRAAEPDGGGCWGMGVGLRALQQSTCMSHVAAMWPCGWGRRAAGPCARVEGPAHGQHTATLAEGACAGHQGRVQAVRAIKASNPRPSWAAAHERANPCDSPHQLERGGSPCGPRALLAPAAAAGLLVVVLQLLPVPLVQGCQGGPADGQGAVGLPLGARERGRGPVPLLLELAAQAAGHALLLGAEPKLQQVGRLGWGGGATVLIAVTCQASLPTSLPPAHAHPPTLCTPLWWKPRWPAMRDGVLAAGEAPTTARWCTIAAAVCCCLMH